MNDINFSRRSVAAARIRSKPPTRLPNTATPAAPLANELTHGFDDEGRQFDAQGNSADWWTEGMCKEFVKRASCISDQYSTYTIIDDIKNQRKLTLGEDVADLGWAHPRIHGVEGRQPRDRPLQPIDGLTPPEIFHRLRQSWCGETRDENQAACAPPVDPHSPEKYRTKWWVSNMPEFQEAFRCKSSIAHGKPESLAGLW